MYEKSLHEQSARIRKTEAENHKVGRRKKRGELIHRIAWRRADEVPRPPIVQASAGRAAKTGR